MSLWEERANLKGKKAVITGGAQGLGFGAANILAQAGCDLMLCDIAEAELTQAAETLRAHGGKVITRHVDVRDRAQLDQFWSAVDTEFSRIDILVNVVGGVRPKDFVESTPEDWDENIRMNFIHVVQSTQHAARRMMQTGGGSIINFTTVEAHRAAPRYAVYTGLKAGVTNFARTLAVELGPHRIRINNIAPDTTPSPGMFKGNDASSYFNHFPRPQNRPGGSTISEAMAFLDEQAQSAIPLQRNGRIEDIENAVLFLASDMSNYITGTTLLIDGGVISSSGWFHFKELGFRNRLPLDRL